MNKDADLFIFVVYPTKFGSKVVLIQDCYPVLCILDDVQLDRVYEDDLKTLNLRAHLSYSENLL
jgi:hypothetical protein